MSKELKNITDTVMDQIHEDKIKIRPKIYFVLGSIFTFIGLIFSMLLSVFLVSLMRFSIRSHGPMGGYRLDQLLSSFPWWAVVLAIIGLFLGLRLLRKYDFSFKIDFKIIAVVFILAIIGVGWFMDLTGLDNVWFRRGPMQGIMRQYIQNNNIPSGLKRSNI